MVLWDSVVGALLDKVAPEVAGYYRDKQRLKHEREIEKLRGKIAWEEALTRRASESEGRDHEWELEMVRNDGWKQEYVLSILSIPLVLSFCGDWGADVVASGFAALEQTPEWYRWLVLVILTAVYGIRIWRRRT